MILDPSVQYEEEEEKITPLARRDLGAWPLGSSNGPLWCIGSMEVDRYVRVPRQFYETGLTIGRLLDGTRTLPEIGREIIQTVPGITQAHVERFYNMLSQSDLILSPKPTYVYHSDIRQLSIDVAKLPLTPLATGLKVILKPPVWWGLNIFGLAIIISATATLLLKPNLLSTQIISISNSYTLGLLLSFLLSMLVVVWHECAHGVAAIRYGLRPHALRLAIYAGIAPLVYMDMRGLYTLPIRQRVIIWLAGVWANLCGAAVLFLLIAFLPLPVIAQQIIWKLIILNLTFISTNLSPFIPTDGYFIMSNLLGKFNLRTQIYARFRGFFHGDWHSSSHLGFFGWAYLVLSLLAVVGGTAFWFWWLWRISLEFFAQASGPLLIHWLAAFLPISGLILCLLLIHIRRRRILP